MLYRCLSKQTRENKPRAHAQHSTALRHAKSPCMLTTLRVPIWQVSDWLDSRDESVCLGALLCLFAHVRQ